MRKIITMMLAVILLSATAFASSNVTYEVVGKKGKITKVETAENVDEKGKLLKVETTTEEDLSIEEIKQRIAFLENAKTSKEDEINSVTERNNIIIADFDNQIKELDSLLKIIEKE